MNRAWRNERRRGSECLANVASSVYDGIRTQQSVSRSSHDSTGLFDHHQDTTTIRYSLDDRNYLSENIHGARMGGTLGVTMPVVCPLMDIAVVTAIFQYSGYYSVLKHNLLLVESFSLQADVDNHCRRGGNRFSKFRIF